MTGQWEHRNKHQHRPMSLDDIRYRGGRMSYPSRRMTAPEWVLPDYLEEAREIFAAAEREEPEGEVLNLTAGFERLRWFPLPVEKEGA